MLGLKV